MKVVDAGVLVELLVGDLDPVELGDEELAAPHLVDSEVTSVLRRLVLRGILTQAQGRAALDGFAGIALIRYPADRLRDRMWELRDNVGAYDATYVALAEQIGATALLTTDARLAAAPGPQCPVLLL